MVSSTVENYLKAILHLQGEGAGSTTVGEIAKELWVTPGTVTMMMRQLKERRLIAYEPRRGVSLLALGRAEALKVVRRHRLIETFLVEVMQLDWSEVHEEAEILEHVISDRLLDRMDKMLGEPTHDPHGDPIPDRNGVIAKNTALSLLEVEAGNYRIVRVSDEDSALLGWLDDKGLTIGEEFSLRDSDRAAGLIELVRRDGESLPLGLQVAGRIFVEAV